MTTVEVDLAALEAAAQIARKDEPVHMLNMLRFRAQADYGQRTNQPPCSGREAFFERYVPIFQRLAADCNPKRVFVGSVVSKLLGPDGANWDDALIVEYPSYEAFCRVVGSEAYRDEAVPHRVAALEDARLFMLERRG